jgi:CRP-like cAMP-binding protein
MERKNEISAFVIAISDDRMYAIPQSKFELMVGDIVSTAMGSNLK